MKTSCFDAIVDFHPHESRKSYDALIVHKETVVPASFQFYRHPQKREPEKFFVRIHTRDPLWMEWNDRFEILEPGGKIHLGNGQVLCPHSEKISPRKREKRIAFLQKLLGNKKEMVLALAQEGKMAGIKERKIILFSSLRRTELRKLCQELEEEGKLRILSFSPLFLLSKDSFDFLCEKILFFLSRFHQKHSKEEGASSERMRERFNLDPKILSLALSRLSREEKIREIDGKYALIDFERVLLPEEECILERLEEMCLKGEFRSVSIEDLRQKFRLPSRKLNMMLSLLTERKKIVQGRDGFIIHSRWLEEIVVKVKDLGRKELSVADFKRMTGLSRKYAIPLLELLDQMGVTQRKGSSREIL